MNLYPTDKIWLELAETGVAKIYISPNWIGDINKYIAKLNLEAYLEGVEIRAGFDMMNRMLVIQLLENTSSLANELRV